MPPIISGLFIIDDVNNPAEFANRNEIEELKASLIDGREVWRENGDDVSFWAIDGLDDLLNDGDSEGLKDGMFFREDGAKLEKVNGLLLELGRIDRDKEGDLEGWLDGLEEPLTGTADGYGDGNNDGFLEGDVDSGFEGNRVLRAVGIIEWGIDCLLEGFFDGV